MKLNELRGRIMAHVLHAPAPYPMGARPADEIRYSHVELIVGAAITYLGYSIGDDGHLVPPLRKRKAKR